MAEGKAALSVWGSVSPTPYPNPGLWKEDCCLAPQPPRGQCLGRSPSIEGALRLQPPTLLPGAKAALCWKDVCRADRAAAGGQTDGVSGRQVGHTHSAVGCCQWAGAPRRAGLSC